MCLEPAAWSRMCESRICTGFETKAERVASERSNMRFLRFGRKAVTDAFPLPVCKKWNRSGAVRSKSPRPTLLIPRRPKPITIPPFAARRTVTECRCPAGPMISLPCRFYTFAPPAFGNGVLNPCILVSVPSGGALPGRTRPSFACSDRLRSWCYASGFRNYSRQRLSLRLRDPYTAISSR